MVTCKQCVAWTKPAAEVTFETEAQLFEHAVRFHGNRVVALLIKVAALLPMGWSDWLFRDVNAP